MHLPHAMKCRFILMFSPQCSLLLPCVLFLEITHKHDFVPTVPSLNPNALNHHMIQNASKVLGSWKKKTLNLSIHSPGGAWEEEWIKEFSDDVSLKIIQGCMPSNIIPIHTHKPLRRPTTSRQNVWQEQPWCSFTDTTRYKKWFL